MDNNYNRRSNYSNAVDTELQRLIEEIMRNYIRPPRTSNNSRSNNERSNEDHLTFLHTLRDITIGYNSNMLEYQSNTRLSLELLQNYLNENLNNPRIPTNNYTSSRDFTEIPTPQQPQSQQRTQSIQNNNTENREHLLSYVVYRPTIRSQDATTLRNFFQNVLIRPTREQINNATELITYNANLENISQTCPITLDEFQDGDIIRQIKHCRHVFHERSIQNWFRTNVRCPVCRYDIRDFRREQTTELQEDITEDTRNTQEMEIERETNDNENNNTENNYNDIFQELSNNITQNLRNIISGNTEEGVTSGYLDSSQNFLFEFEIR
uniref:RING-type domain-containing protein n=1 Tax=viral metagenome TaxID=1070528 RepID=A0A6C0HT30_9ZZZZ